MFLTKKTQGFSGFLAHLKNSEDAFVSWTSRVQLNEHGKHQILFFAVLNPGPYEAYKFVLACEKFGDSED